MKNILVILILSLISISLYGQDLDDSDQIKESKEIIKKWENYSFESYVYRIDLRFMQALWY